MGADIVWQLTNFALQLLTYATGLFASGGVLFLLLFSRVTAAERARIAWAVLVLAVIGLAVAALVIPVRVGYLNAGGIDGMFDPFLLEMLAFSPVGVGVLLRVLGFALIVLVIWRHPLGAWVSGTGALLVIASLTVTGHAGVYDALIGRSLIAIHLVGAAYWLGALWPLLLIVRAGEHARAGAILERFGVIAMFLVGALVLAGVVLSVLLLGSLAALWQTAYGITLMIKLALVAVLLLLAALNRFRLVPGLIAGDGQAAGALRGAIALEIVLALLILLTTAILTTYFSPFG
ncbi:hypothetical protein CAI21_13510 [Alkalilimnicola ehrlichii]|uniref:Copper resistance protein D n=1 Tax=Alkalilimnicola ehrlichii TaxID=351052 RepID=A0A3E0WQW4_9GAMM|nr:CopD family protein [Alkalilimnicola ehrlichii]RFA27937.1 hypothetical protein CAI21_13510 [Alkalilimnicola ehrlichii]RFA34583.1 hypothetical protein CAL65_14540 [Alkalilimnicola ehrlichii]